MGNQGQALAEGQKFRQHRLNVRGVLEHAVGNAGEIHNFLGQGPAGVHKALEPAQLLAVLEDYPADFNDLVPEAGQASGLQVKGHIGPREIHVPQAVHHNPVVHIIDIISFAAVEHLDGLAGSRHNGLPGGLHGLGKCLGTAVVGDGNGGVAPGGGLFYGGGRFGEGVHVGHVGVQVQLHPLVLGGVQALWGAVGQNGHGLQYHLIVVPVDYRFAQHFNPSAHLGGVHNGPALGYLAGAEKPVDPDGAGEIGDVHAHHQGVALGQLPVLHRKDLAGHAGRAHVQVHLLDGHRRFHKGLAKNHAGGLYGGFDRLGRLGRGPSRGGQMLAHLGHFLEQRIALQSVVGLHGDGHRAAEPAGQVPSGLRQAGLQLRLSVGPEANGQLIAGPGPPALGQNTHGPGIQGHKQLRQLFGLNFGQIRRWELGVDFHLPHIVKAGEIPAGLLQQPPGDIAWAAQGKADDSGFRVHLGILNFRPGQQTVQGRRRGILGKHLEKGNSHV